METEAERITSIKDPRVSEARELSSAAGRTRLRKCLLEGVESVQWALDAGIPVEHIFYSPVQDRGPLFARLRTMHIPCYAVSDGILKKISDTSYLVPCIGVARTPDALSGSDTIGDLVVVLDRVQDHGNIGTIIRTASAFGIRDIISTTAAMDLYYKKIISASRGRVFDVRLRRYSSGAEAVAALRQLGYQIVATSSHASNIQALAPLQAKPVALVVGNETEGISDEIVSQADIVVQIPMSGQVESLNVGVATGISLYELKFRMVLTMLIKHIRANLGREVNVTGSLIQQAFDAQIKQHSPLSGQQAILLMMLICDGAMSLDDVTRETGTFGQERDVLLQPLFAQGFIRYQAGNENAIVPTEEAERILAQIWSVVERADNAVLSGFSENEKAQFADYLKRIQVNCLRITEQDR